MSAPGKKVGISDQEKAVKDLAELAADIELDPTDPHVLDECTLRRFLFANEWKVPAAHHALRSTMEWRFKTKPWSITLDQVRTEFETHKAYLTGAYDKDDHPVFLSMVRRHSVHHRIPEETSRLVLYNMEEIVRRMTKPGIHQYTLVVDCSKFCMECCDMTCAKEMARVFQVYYPERIYRILVINHNRMFKWFWGVLRHFVAKETADKIKFMNTQDQLRTELGDVAYDAIKDEVTGQTDENFKHPDVSKETGGRTNPLASPKLAAAVPETVVTTIKSAQAISSASPRSSPKLFGFSGPRSKKGSPAIGKRDPARDQPSPLRLARAAEDSAATEAAAAIAAANLLRGSGSVTD